MLASLDGVDVVAAIGRSAGATDRERVASFMAPYIAMMHPEVECDVAEAGIPGAGPACRGRAETIDFWTAWLNAWDEYRWRSRDWTAIGECAIVDVTPSARSRADGAHGGETTHLYRFRDGYVGYFALFADRDDAIRAAEEFQ